MIGEINAEIQYRSKIRQPRVAHQTPPRLLKPQAYVEQH